MAEDSLSEEKIKKDCPHCDPNSFALKHPLEETSNFWVVCDVHPLTEGHILVIPKHHLSCIGEFNADLYAEFIGLYDKFMRFVKDEYEKAASFEHGKIGQTVFHSHVHLLPYDSEPLVIVPEGEDKLTQIHSLDELKDVFNKGGQYLFFSIGDRMWLVDNNIGAPRFFRDRFSQALGKPERGNWKQMHDNKEIMKQAGRDIERLKSKWKKHMQK